MALLYHWQSNNYYHDMAGSPSFCLVQNNPFMSKVAEGAPIWAFTRNREKRYVLAAELVVSGTRTVNDEQYGVFAVDGDPKRSRYFDVEHGPDVESLIRSMNLAANASVLGSSFQGLAAVRKLVDDDDAKLRSFAANLLQLAKPETEAAAR